MRKYLKNPKLILFLIVSAFIFKGVLLANLFPIFSGQDEARHYNTIQYLTEPEEKEWPIDYPKNESQIKGKFSTYNFSQEIRKTAKIMEDDKVAGTPYDAMVFGKGEYEGKNEAKINSEIWPRINDKYPPDVVGSKKFYHKLMSYVENLLSSQSILVRFFLLRIIGVLIGAIFIYVCYLIAKKTGFSEIQSLLLCAIISFHPGLSVYYVSINYDVLVILSFAVFSLGAVLSIREGLNAKNVLLMIAAVIFGIFSKPTAIVLLACLILILIWSAYEKIRNQKLNRQNVLIFLILFVIISSAFFYNYEMANILPLKKDKSLMESVSFADVKKYLGDSLVMGRIKLTSNSYWGNVGWENNFIADNLIYFIWTIEAIAFLGLLYLLLRKKKIDYLPEKKYLLFFVGMIIILQLGIRYADFVAYNNLGRFDLGAPGRYFLPNLASHIILVFAGLGALLKKEKYFDFVLKIGLILMFSYSFYIIFNMVIPRFYL